MMLSLVRSRSRLLRRLFCGWRARLPRHQLVDLVDRMTLGDLCQRILEIGFRVHTVELCRLNNGVYGRCAITTGIRTGEEKILAPQSNDSHGILGNVVVDFQPTVCDEAGEGFAPIDRIMEGC